MGYIEDLRDQRLEEFYNELLKKKEEMPEDYLFQEDFSILSFSGSIKDGWKTIHEINKLIKAVKERKKQLDQLAEKFYLELKKTCETDKSLSNEKKKNLLKGFKDFRTDFSKDESNKIKKLSKIKYDTLLRVCNIFIYFITVILSFGFGGLLYINNKIISAIIFPISLITILGFATLQAIYTVKYLKAIKSTLRGIIVFSIKRTFSTTLVIWLYSFIISIVNALLHSNFLALHVSLYTFAAIFVLYIIFIIYDLFLSASIFDEIESSISLVAAIIIGLVSFADVFKNEIVTKISSIFLLLACFLLTLLIIKKFLFDKKSLKNILQILYIGAIIVATIALTIASLYRLLWIPPADGQVADNTLFSAVVGVYAAFIGGGLTLTGVAWTIKNSEKQRKDEERRKSQPLFTYVYKKLNSDRLTVIYCDKLKEIETIIDEKEDSTEWLSIENFSIENSSKTEFFIVGIYINGVLYRTLSKELIKKDYCVYFNFGNKFFTINSLNEIMIYVEDLMGNTYTMQLEYLINEHIVSINGNKQIQFTGENNE